jgi:hypothetical protein
MISLTTAFTILMNFLQFREAACLYKSGQVVSVTTLRNVFTPNSESKINDLFIIEPGLFRILHQYDNHYTIGVAYNRYSVMLDANCGSQFAVCSLRVIIYCRQCSVRRTCGIWLCLSVPFVMHTCCVSCCLHLTR